MADYINLPVMEEVFFEILPHVSLKKKKSDYEITISNRVDNMLYVFTPCIMIDGVVIRDPAVRPGKDGKVSVEFWSADNKADYLINIQGITQAGETISIKKIISVKQ